MMERKQTLGILALTTAVYYGLVQYVWIQNQQLGLTLLLFGSSLAVGAWLLKGTGAALRRPQAPVDAVEPPRNLPILGLFVGLLLVLIARYGYQGAVAADWTSLLAALVCAGLLVRLTKPKALPELTGKTWAWSLLALFALAAAFRLYRIGTVPVGFCGMDEPYVWYRARLYFQGLRATYDMLNLTQGADGTVPLYMMALGLKAFGSSMTGFRLEGALVGILLVGLTFRLGKDIGGRWVGALAAFLWAVSIWPVTITRAQYYITESTFVVTLCMAALAAAFRRGGAWRFILAGFFWGLCFNAYPATRVMAGLVPWLFFLVWYLVPARRQDTLAGSLPLFFGFVVAMAPLLLWMRSEPNSLKAYFVAFGVGHQGGDLGSGSLLHRIDLAFSRIMFEFPRNFALLTSRGPVSAHFFPLQYPVVHGGMLACAIVGVGVSLARFREPLQAFLLYWWAAGLIPAMASANTTVPHDRRAMMVLMPTILLAATGAVAVLRQLWTFAAGMKLTRYAFAAALAAVLGLYTADSWSDYFERNQKDPDLMMDGRANHALLLRAMHEELKAHPAVVISTWRLDNNSWSGALDDPYNGGEWDATNPQLAVEWFQRGAEHYAQGGLRASLARAAARVTEGTGADGKAPDILVVLVPFYYYLEPALKGAGAELVRTVGLAVSSKGPMTGWDLAFHPTEFARLYRISGKDFKVATLALPGPFKVVVTELQPPKGTRQEWRNTDQRTEKSLEAKREVLDHPGRWKALRKVDYALSDPWFWITDGNLPGAISAPLSLQMKLGLKIPAEGEYAFGASASVLTRLKVDGKVVYERDPLDPKEHLSQKDIGAGEDLAEADDKRERSGTLGSPVRLAAGPHRLEIDQVMLGTAPTFNLLLRPIWKAPGRGTETLPLEILQSAE